MIGKGGHASEPEKCIDQIAAANRIYQHLQLLIPEDARSVITTTVFHAGNTQNIFPDEALIMETVRTFSGRDTESIHRKMEEICRNAGTKSGAECILEFRTSMGSACNDEAMTKLFRRAVSRYAGAASLVQPDVCFKGGTILHLFLSKFLPFICLLA